MRKFVVNGSAIVLMSASLAASASPETSSGADADRGSVFDLVGSTRHPVLPNAQVDVHVGGIVSSAQADSDGRFEVSVDCSQPDQLVVVQARGAGNQSAIEHARLVHSCGYLQTQLDMANQFQAGLLSPLSTGVYAALRWFVENEESLSWPVSLSQIESYLNIIQLSRVSWVIEAHSYIGEGDVPLPAGLDTTLELALDRSALTSVVDQGRQIVPFEDRLPRLQAIHWDVGLLRKPSLPNPPEYTWAYCVSLFRACPWYADLASDQSMYYGIPTSGGSGEWLDRGLQSLIFGDRMEVPEDNLRALRMTGSSGDPLFFSVSFPVIDGEQVEQRFETVWFDVRIPDASELLDLLATASKTRLTYPNNPEIPDQIFEPSLVFFQEGLTSLANLPAWQGPQGGEEWLLPIQTSPSLSPDTELVTLNGDGTALAQLSGTSLAWQYSGDTLILSGASVPDHHVHFIGGIPGRHDSFLVEVGPGEASIRAFSEEGIEATDQSAFVAEEVPGRYLGGFDLDTIMPSDPATDLDEVFTFDLFSDGTGLNATLPNATAPMPSTARPVVWEIDAEGRLVIERTGSSSSIVRRWTRAAVSPSNGDIFMIETSPEFVSDGDSPAFARPRFNFYRPAPLP